MISTSFVEQPTDLHVRLRHDLLESGVRLPEPARVISARAAAFPGWLDDVQKELREFGVAVVQLDEPLSTDSFITLGAALGTAMPELDPAVLPYVEKNVVLNLVTDFGYTSDVSLQPFASNILTLHTESSGRPVAEQPRYIVLMCCAPGDNGAAAQTVLVPMTAVERQLTSLEIAILSQSKYRNSNGPAIVRVEAGRRVFSFRDFLGQTLEVAYSGDDLNRDALVATVRRLLASTYAKDAAIGINWTLGMLVIIDNTFFFHGRTMTTNPTAIRRRHLKRLRILST